jgi:hypothetical protein
MARYLLINTAQKRVENILDIDPANINDGSPCPPDKLLAIPQPDKITQQEPITITPPEDVHPQPDLVTPQPPIEKLDADGKPVLDENGQPVMEPQPDLITKQPDQVSQPDDIVTYPPPLVEPQPDLMVDDRWPVPEGFMLEESDLGNVGDSWPLPPPAAPDPNLNTLSQISVLEQSISDRRMREAILGTDNGWLKGVNDKITGLRKTLV